MTPVDADPGWKAVGRLRLDLRLFGNPRREPIARDSNRPADAHRGDLAASREIEDLGAADRQQLPCLRRVEEQGQVMAAGDVVLTGSFVRELREGIDELMKRFQCVTPSSIRTAGGNDERPRFPQAPFWPPKDFQRTTLGG